MIHDGPSGSADKPRRFRRQRFPLDDASASTATEKNKKKTIGGGAVVRQELFAKGQSEQPSFVNSST